MTDNEITEQLGMIISAMATNREEYSKIIRDYLDAEREATIYIAAGLYLKLKNKEVAASLVQIAKPNVAEKQALVELEIGEIAFKKAVIDNEMKMLEKQAKTLETLAFHTASLRKAERS